MGDGGLNLGPLNPNKKIVMNFVETVNSSLFLLTGGVVIEKVQSGDA